MLRRRSWSLHVALWVAACALLLKAAVPLLATASAQLQGKTVVEVCTAFGVATVALPDGEAPPDPWDVDGHAGEHCVLTAVLAWAAPTEQSAPWDLPAVSRAPPPARNEGATGAPDATAQWVARLKHGPPSFS